MVQAIINIEEHTNRILNMVKAKYGLKDKSQAIDQMALQYEQEIMEPEIRPEYAKKLLKIDKEGFKSFSSIEELRREIENA